MDWKDIVRTVAPTLGAALGGPPGAMAVKFLADKVLGRPDATEGEVEDFILGASPEQMLMVKKADQEFKLRMRELDIDVFKLEVTDRGSARDLAKVDMMPHIVLSAAYTVGYFAVVYLFINGQVQVQQEHNVLFGTVLGVLTTAQIAIMNFWFGSSSGSKSKTTPTSNGTT